MTDACTNAPTHSRKPCCKRLSGQKETDQTSTHCINVWSNYGRSVIIGFQKTQIYQRFAGSRQEVFILIYGQPYFHKYVCCKLAVEFYSRMGYTMFERS